MGDDVGVVCFCWVFEPVCYGLDMGVPIGRCEVYGLVGVVGYFCEV